MEKKNWHWEEIPFIPDGVVALDILRIPGHIFVRSNIVRDLKVKGMFRKKERKRQKRRKE